MSVFETLNKIDVNDKTEKRGGLTYLSWAWAWNEVKKHYPDAYYTIYENADGWFYLTDGMTCWVKTGVTIEGLEHIEYLPVMDYKNKSIPVEKVTSFDVNKAIQRSLTKAIARHGLGLYIYAGEDLPEEAKKKVEEPDDDLGFTEQFAAVSAPVCEVCGRDITDITTAKGNTISAAEAAKRSIEKYGKVLCVKCAKEKLVEW